MCIPLRRFVDDDSIAYVVRFIAATPGPAMQANPYLGQLLKAIARIGMAECVLPMAKGTACLGCGKACDGTFVVSNLMPYFHIPLPDGPFVLDYAQACCQRGGICERVCHEAGAAISRGFGLPQTIVGRNKL